MHSAELGAGWLRVRHHLGPLSSPSGCRPQVHRMTATGARPSTNYHRQVRLLGLDRSDVGGQIHDPQLDEAVVLAFEGPEQVTPYRHFLRTMGFEGPAG
jgi:hypothetical protein